MTPVPATALAEALREAFDRLTDFVVVQTAGDRELELADVLCLQESVGIDDDARAMFASRLDEVQPDAPVGAVLLGVLLGLSAAQLQAERA
ncbi:hypothetical protein DSM112329_04739 [Paraconexibacter sp. AEG42_29]|uniref:Uncharacterized protein n=1 Tax=Paraconexibacter sp. AEG42_29 TaxID=2997339 RepID=A0AAU7B2E5_9ACTN